MSNGEIGEMTHSETAEFNQMAAEERAEVEEARKPAPKKAKKGLDLSKPHQTIHGMPGVTHAQGGVMYGPTGKPVKTEG